MPICFLISQAIDGIAFGFFCLKPQDFKARLSMCFCPFMKKTRTGTIKKQQKFNHKSRGYIYIVMKDNAIMVIGRFRLIHLFIHSKNTKYVPCMKHIVHTHTYTHTRVLKLLQVSIYLVSIETSIILFCYTIYDVFYMFVISSQFPHL